MAGSELVLANARLVLADRVMHGGVRIVDGRIAEVWDGAPVPVGAEDLEGDLLLPGLIDLHTDNVEKHFVPRPGVTWNPMMAALAHDAQIAAAGITTVFDSLSLDGGRSRTDRRAIFGPIVAGIRTAADRGALRAAHYLHLRCELTNADMAEMLAPFVEDPTLRLLSIMDHTPGQRQFRDLAIWRRHYSIAHGLDTAALDSLYAERRAAQERLAPANRRLVMEVARTRAVPVASHDDETPGHVAEAAALGIAISEFPVSRAAAEAAHAHGMSVLMGAPNLVCGGSHSGNVAAAELAGDGLVDMLASDYVPVSLLHGAFLLTGADVGMALPAAVATVTRNVAVAVGLTDRGEIAPERRADLIRVRPIDGVPVVRTVWRHGRRVL